MNMLRYSLWLYLFCSLPVFANPSNPPTWPASSITHGGVFVFDPTTPNLQTTINDIYSTNGLNSSNQFQFSNNRYALLFLPGTYTDLQVNVGYYTSVIGLGKTPKDTSIENVASLEESDSVLHGALDTFWRSAENFSTTPTQHAWAGGPIGMPWAVSQGCALRKVEVNGTLWLFQVPTGAQRGGYASGGFMADCSISGEISPGSQQQWFTRNTDMPSWSNGVWNMVFVGCNGAPPTHCGNCSTLSVSPGNPYTTVSQTPKVAEKPYIVADPTGNSWSLMIPQLETNKIGTSQDNTTPLSCVSFDQVYVTDPAADTAASISAQIAAGNHILLTPGIYHLTGTIEVKEPNTVILGIGYPTLISTTGEPCITVGSVDGVRIGGILLQAGPKPTSTLLKWGPVEGDQSIASGFLYDCFARVGRFDPNSTVYNQVDKMVQINCSNIICDNLWLWRADHDAIDHEVMNRDNLCNTGLEVNGNNVIAYSLAVEHTLQDLTLWNGNHGQCYFYQSEYPYDVSQENYGNLGYVGYKVGNSVTNHQAWGVGVYSNFIFEDVTMQSGISTPQGSGIQFINSLTRYLNNKGGILHVINNSGEAVNAQNLGPSYVCDPLPTQSVKRRLLTRCKIFYR